MLIDAFQHPKICCLNMRSVCARVANILINFFADSATQENDLNNNDSNKKRKKGYKEAHDAGNNFRKIYLSLLIP